MKYISDEILMVRVRDKGLDDLSILFDRYKGKLYNFFLRQTYDKDVSMDLVQNVFYRIIKYKHTYNELHPFKTWMYQIARNVMATHFKKQKMVLSDNDFGNLVDESGDSYFENEENKEKQKQLHNAMNKLSDEQRELLLLSRFQGLKYKEIADMSGTTEGAVKVKVHRAMQKLKNVFFSA